MSKLREQRLAELQLRGLTPKTQKIYLREVSNYAKHFNKSPEELGEKELKEYLLYLLNERKLSEGTYRFYYSGLKFMYKHTLKREWIVENIKAPKRKKTLPVVLDLSEVKALLSVVENIKHRAILTITYSAGLRIAETRHIFCDAKKRAGITKPASPHTLRHSFATHLIEAGTSLHHVQLLLGHRSPTTTTVYLHVSKMNLAQVTSPLDSIPEQL